MNLMIKDPELNLSPLQTCMVCSRSRHGLYHSRY